jgi:hypothetical protein
MHAGEVQLYDIYVAGVWCGSRRTVAQCRRFLAMRNQGALLAA